MMLASLAAYLTGALATGLTAWGVEGNHSIIIDGHKEVRCRIDFWWALLMGVGWPCFMAMHTLLAAGEIKRSIVRAAARSLAAEMRRAEGGAQ